MTEATRSVDMSDLPVKLHTLVSVEFKDSDFADEDQEEPNEPIEATQVEHLLGQSKPLSDLPSALERRYLKDIAPARLQTILFSGMLVVFLYNTFLFSDKLLIPDQFDQALRLRLFIFTPILIVALFLLPRLKALAAREWFLIVPSAVACGINIWLCAHSNSEYAGPYLACLATIVIFANSVLRMRLYPALTLNGIVTLMFIAGAWHMPVEQYATVIPGGLLVFCTILLTSYGCYSQERDERLNWLLHLREQVLLQDLETANLSLHEASRVDMLTEVGNRRYFDENMSTTWLRLKECGGEIAVLMIDVDHFKAYNDRYGHPAGDACLKAVAGALKRRLRGPGDVIARFGGEEFIAVLTNTSLETAKGAAERIRRSIEGLNILHARSHTHSVVTASIGVATALPSDTNASITRLVSAADEALYQAKERGRNQVVVWGHSEP